ncbi:MAG: hypothetical protein K8R87_06975 [Verrucomicrobia bacterium]|nr:hypothetical protein [Verrucomicrobiota bacterium]
MREVIRVVQAICDLVPTGGMMPADKELFITFIQWREQAAVRLNEIMAALDGRDEYRALQISEMEPRLPGFMAHLGLVNHMGLSEEKKWKAYCQKHGLPSPPVLDPAAVQRLHDLYMKGITTESPFYKECIAAMKAGDEVRALALIRSIVRLTKDTAARAQMDVMLKKQSHAQLVALRNCLERGEEDGVLAWLDEFELEEAADQARQGNWPNVCARIARIRRLHSEWGINLVPEQIALLAKLEKEEAEIKAETELKSKFIQSLASLMSYVGRLQHLLQDDEHLSPVDIRKMQESLSELQAAVARYYFPVPQEDASRVQEIVLLLEDRLSRQEHSRRVRFATINVIVIILVGALWLMQLYGDAQAQLRELEALRDGRMAGAANQVLLKIMQSSASWMLNLSPETRAKLEALRKWAGLELKRMEEVDADMAEIDTLLASSSEEQTPEELMQKMLEMEEEMKKLAPDYLRAMQTKFKGLQGRVQDRLRALLAQNVQKVRQMLGVLEKLAADLDFEKSVQELTVTLATIQSKLREITPLEHPTVPALTLPEDINVALGRIRSKSKLYAQELTTFSETKNSMAATEKLEPYRLALAACAKLRFKECREAEAMLAVLPGEDETLARLFFSGDVKTLRLAKQQASAGFRFIPQEITPDELKRLAALGDDPNLRAVGPAKKLVETTQFRQAVKPAGGKFSIPLLDLMDRIVRFSDGDVLVKAFLFQELGGVMRARGPAWGLHFCPELTLRFNELDSIFGNDRIRSGDWNKPGFRKKWQAQLERFFTAIVEDGPYFGLAEASRDRVATVATTGLNLTGYIDGANESHLKKSDQEQGTAYAFSAENMKLILIKYISGTLPTTDAKTLQKWSPIFNIPGKIPQPEIKRDEKISKAGVQ